MPRFLVPEPVGPVEAGGSPEFSIIVPAYEAAETIGAAVESALTQTLPPKEVVICDDGSRDDLTGALSQFGDRVIVIRQENAGPAAARNAAAARATGEFIVNLDSDDVLLPGNLEARAELLAERPDLDIVGTDGFVELDGVVMRNLYQHDWRFEVDDQRTAILERCFIAMFWAIRRRRLLAVGGFDESISHAEDWECFARLVLSGSLAGLVDEPLARYRLHQGSLTNQAEGLATGRIQMMEKTLAHPNLSGAERDALDGRLKAEQFELRLIRLREAILGRSPTVRGESRRLMVAPGVPLDVRLRAALSWTLPRVARRLLAKRGRMTGAGVTLPVE